MSGTFDPTTLTADDFATQAIQLPPRGNAWSRDPTALLRAVISGSSDTIADSHAIAVDILVNETDPTLTDQLLPDWERVYGLPDPCTPINPTIAQRRTALLARIAAQGGQSPAYFEALAAVAGVTIVVTRMLPSWAGVLQAGGLLYGPQALGEWTIQVTAGDPEAIAQMQCIIEREQPGQAAIYWELP